ncbi:hypothetical protein B1B15_08450 [Cutibacterium acnes]|uniref:Uncharacterized protein n=1 Tax=Cutibacterium acnes TaxID=1747 RepID=A0AA44QHZ2_CUTAC|nr:hypothetical protein B1B06_09615 [Cutibacterium acnes subsp. acnes]PGF33934.1 hypothetical protein B1B09_08565 [Cutibacterium acnes]PGF35678.1 hypothetical protein B1B10_04290 [Cutibacterium acnes subsp. acnes]PGF37880.1 hypothetical protein B1B11_00490 [Cutibacterium acnes subsp. acnes]PGF41768.1 hypothetical protein B1B15_08450 [Cutibacterium acnes]
MRCKADGNGLVYSSPDQVSDDACTQDRRADNRGRDSGVEGAADDVLDGCLLEMDAPSDEKSCLGGDLSFDEFELRDGPEGGVQCGGDDRHGGGSCQVLVDTSSDEVCDDRVLERG